MDPSTVLCKLEDIPDGGAIAVNIDSSTGGFEIILSRRGEVVSAFHNECPHQGRRLDYAPGQFLIKDGNIICAAHGATFRLDSGICLGGPCRNGLVPVPVRVEAGMVCSAA